MNEQILLHRVQVGDYKTTKNIIEDGVDVNTQGGLPLMMAVSNGFNEIAKLLVEEGADIHIHDDMPVLDAAARKNVELVEFLFSRGANLHTRNDLIINLAGDDARIANIIRTSYTKRMNVLDDFVYLPPEIKYYITSFIV